MNELHDQFVAEARELIQQVTDDLIVAERDGFSDERIDRVFRAFHTLKGSAGVVELPPMGIVLHAAEDVLAEVQASRIGATPSLIDSLLVCLDQVAQWVDQFEADRILAPNSGDVAQAVTGRLRSFLAKVSSGGAAPSRSEESSLDALPVWVNRLIETQAARLRPPSPVAIYSAFSYQPRSDCFFDGDDPLALVRRVPNLVAFNADLAEPPLTLASIDAYACNLRLEGIAAATPADLAAVFRLVPDQVSIVEIPPRVPQSPLPACSDHPTALASLVIREQAALLRTGGDADSFAGRTGSAVRATIGALHHCGREDLVEAVEQAGIAAGMGASAADLLVVLEETLRLLVVTSERPAGETSGEGTPVARSISRPQNRLLRVDETRVDSLVDLAGELLVAANGLGYLAWQAETESDRHMLATAVRERKEAMERVAVALHDSALQLRMVPVAQVFRSFPRAVRDLARQLGKEVALETLGQTTEVDKSVADLLFEPLLHLMRNALDHGIEAPDQRRAAGKPLPARLALEARRVGDRLIVDVADDGRGIDPQMVRREARERQLMPDDELAALSDERTIDLIFAAGFSTASNVSSVSGRGVGMDAVRSTIERIGGRVEIKSRVDVGTTVTLDFPMKIALLRIMVVEAGGQPLGIPMDAVLETVRLTPDRLTRFKNNEGFVLHDRVVPICSLAGLLGLPVDEAGRTERLVIVAEVGGKMAGLEVDAIRERVEVVLKPLQGLLSKARAYAGTTLLSDGMVLLVLDLKELLS